MGNLFFYEYNFSIISNLFDYNNSYALYRCAEIENVRKNCTIPVFGEDLKIKGKNSNTICFKACSRNTEIAIIECKFSKNFRESMPSDPLTKTVTVILFKLTQPENLRSKMSNFGALPLKKFSLYSREYAEAVPRGGSHLRGLAPGQHSSEETSQRRRAAAMSWPGSRSPDLPLR